MPVIHSAKDLSDRRQPQVLIVLRDTGTPDGLTRHAGATSRSESLPGKLDQLLGRKVDTVTSWMQEAQHKPHGSELEYYSTRNGFLQEWRSHATSPTWVMTFQPAVSPNANTQTTLDPNSKCHKQATATTAFIQSQPWPKPSPVGKRVHYVVPGTPISGYQGPHGTTYTGMGYLI